MSQLKLYTDPASPLCRAVMLLLATNKVPHEVVPVNLRAGEQKTNPELARVNPNKKVPAIDDDGFFLFESVAILKYICNKYDIPDHWYPKDIHKRARVDEALAWFPGTLRSRAFGYKCVDPRRTGKPTPEAVLELSQVALRKSVEMIESHFLKNNKFIAGDEISIADVLFITEISSYWLIGYDLYEGQPLMTKWFEECKKYLQPHFDDVHQGVYKTIEAKVFAGHKMDYY